MKCCLVSAPVTNDFTDEKIVSQIKRYPPLGVLTLASALRGKCIEPFFFDLNDLYLDWLSTASGSPKGSDIRQIRLGQDRLNQGRCLWIQHYLQQLSSHLAYRPSS